MRRLVLALALLVCSAQWAAAQMSGNIPPNTVLGNPLSFNSPARPVPFSSIIVSGGITNADLAPGPANTGKGSLNGSSIIDLPFPGCVDAGGQHINYTLGVGFSCGNTSSLSQGVQNISAGRAVVPLDCGKTSFITGAASFTFSFPANPTSNGFAAGCQITLVNTNLSNGMQISGIGILSPWTMPPTTTFTAAIFNNTWVLIGSTGSIYLPTPFMPVVSYEFFADPAGVDTNDCMTASTPCTLNKVCGLRTRLDTSVTMINIRVNNGVYNGADSTAMCTIFGNVGGGAASALTNITGNSAGSAVFNIGDSGTGIFVKDAGELGIQNITFQTRAGGATATAITAGQMSIVDMGVGVAFGPMPGGTAIVSSNNSVFNINNPYNINGSASTHISINYGGQVIASARYNINTPVNFSAQFLSNVGGIFAINGGQFACQGTGCAGTTGLKYYHSGGCMYTGGATPLNSFLAGDRKGVTPATGCIDYHTVYLYNDLPACTTANMGVMYFIGDASATTWGAVTVGGGFGIQMVMCLTPNYKVVG